MPLLYKLHKIVRTFKDGRTDKANNKWFARAVNVGTAETDELAEAIAYSTTVTPADCRAVLKALGVAIRDMLRNSRAVKLDNIGTFKAGIQCKGAESVAEFSVQSNVVGIHCNFVPEYKVDSATGKRIVAMLDGIKITETPLNTVIKD